LIFYFDLACPPDKSLEALMHLQTGLVEAVASGFGISSGDRCESPPFDGTSWMVQFVSNVSDYTRVKLFGT
jgi:hypothetical protein